MPLESREHRKSLATTADGRRSLQLFAPQFWPVWLGLGLLRLLILLPFRMQMTVGRALGRVAWLVSKRHRRIADINIRLCLPELSPAERTRLLKRHFAALGCAIFDTGLSWLGDDRRLLGLTHLEGLEHLERSLAAGRGAMLVSAHFTAMEMGVRVLALRTTIAFVYQKVPNALIADLFRRCSARCGVKMILSDDVREFLRALKANRAVWFAPDQREEPRSCALAPFFGIPVVTNTAPERMARISGAPLLPFFIEHRADGRGYLARIGPPLAGYPSADGCADAARLNALIEAQVRRSPEQYLWTYKRFKRPGPDGDPYQQSNRKN
jgi:KDO2-lipid IV(A) lauroyltransferase